LLLYLQATCPCQFLFSQSVFCYFFFLSLFFSGATLPQFFRISRYSDAIVQLKKLPLQVARPHCSAASAAWRRIFFMNSCTCGALFSLYLLLLFFFFSQLDSPPTPIFLVYLLVAALFHGSLSIELFSPPLALTKPPLFQTVRRDFGALLKLIASPFHSTRSSVCASLYPDCPPFF